MKLCRDLIKDLQKHIEDYSSIYEPEDRLEWQLVVSEVKAFLEAEYIVRVVDVDSSSVVLSHRLRGHELVRKGFGLDDLSVTFHVHDH